MSSTTTSRTFGLPFGVSANTLADGQHISMVASATTVNDVRAFVIVVAFEMPGVSLSEGKLGVPGRGSQAAEVHDHAHGAFHICAMATQTQAWLT